MTSAERFDGFPKEALGFFKALIRNNNRDWFESHRDEYEANVMNPSRAFVVEMGERLRRLVPAIQAVPLVNQSLFRVNRDIRFSRDKSPYKAHLGIYLWEGERKRMECSGFYFHLESGKAFTAVGLHMFPSDILNSFRGRVSRIAAARALKKVIGDIEKTDGFTVGGPHYKRVPRGYEANETNEELLRYNGLYAHSNISEPSVLHSPELLDICFQKYAQMLPLHKWLVQKEDRNDG